MRCWLFLLLLLTLPASAAEDIVSGLSQDQIEINSSYTGTDIVVFGTIERPSQAAGRDIVVVVRGPDTGITVRRRDRIAGVWVNSDAAKFTEMPAFYFLASTRPLNAIAGAEVLDRYGLGAMHLLPGTIVSHHDPLPFRQAAVRQLTAQGLYREAPGAIDFHSENLFKTVVPIPAAVARGQYNVEVYLFRGGDVESVQSTPFFIDQTGLERRLNNFAHNQPLGYGLLAVFMSLLFGWATSVLMRRPG
ncbi:MAG: TIGR02186 family protein [Alphaproteobacteria bacterium]|nr:TIGR02186 family protein [Alphaproteobacteria bacterium]